VDVYLTCGVREGRWLGSIPKKGAAAFEIPPEAARCASGRNSFLAVSDGGGSYWARPVRLQAGEQVDLVIERYVGRDAKARWRPIVEVAPLEEYGDNEEVEKFLYGVARETRLERFPDLEGGTDM
jgi:hypothetical protein